MDATIMALDSTDPAATPLPLAALAAVQHPQEIALAWVHLPSGGAAVQGIVRHPDGGPIVAGSKLRNRPVGAGGTEVLSPGAEPPTSDPGHALNPSQWALESPHVVEPLLADRGWRLLSRTDAVLTLISQGYRMRQSTQPGHVVFLDQGDDLIWHDWTVGGKAFPYVQAAFVIRRLPALTMITDTGTDADAGSEVDAGPASVISPSAPTMVADPGPGHGSDQDTPDRDRRHWSA